MNKQETISVAQMASCFLAFITGSSIIYIPNILVGLAKNGAWISLLLSASLGFLILAFILYLYKKFPQLSLIQISQNVFGNWLTIPVAIGFIIYVLLMVTWIVIGIGGFFTTTMMRETPSYMFYALTLFTSALTVRAGIEVIARMFTLLLIVSIFFGSAIVLLALPFYHIEYLFPILPDGLKPVMHGAYFTSGFPHSELIIFAMLLPFVQKNGNEKLGIYLNLSLLVNAFILVVVTLCSIMALGPMAAEIKYSIYQLAIMVNVADFIERVESVIGLSLILGSYMKTTLALFALNLAVSHFLKLRNDKLLLFPLTLTCFLLGLVMFKNEAEFIEKFTYFWPFMTLFLVLIPLLLIVFAVFLRGIFSQKKPIGDQPNPS